MNARMKAVTVWTALGGVGILAGVLAFGQSAKTQMVNPFPPVELVSIKAGGGQPTGNSSGAVASGDGRCVAFYTDANDLLPQGPSGDSNGFSDVYVYDRDAGLTTRVSVGLGGAQPNGPSQAQRFRPSIDRACTCVAFSSDATNLVPGDTNDVTDVFVRDLAGATTELVSVGEGGAAANGGSSFASVDAECDQVAFHSVASNLVADDTNRASDVFVYNRGTGAVTRVSVGPGGEQANGPSITPSFSSDGRCVAFASAATNLMAGVSDTNNALDIYVACDGVVTCRASVNGNGEEANAMSLLPVLSDDGRVVAFKSNATNLVGDDRNQSPDVFVHDCVSGATVRASVGYDGREGNDIAIPPSISGDGRFVAFGSFASNLLDNVNPMGSSQVYVRDLVNNTTVLVSSNLDGGPGNGSVPDLPPSISEDGGWVAFASLATDLISTDTQGHLDAFIRANVTVAPTSTRTITPPPTPTPTRRIPCRVDTDCPAGQVCGPDDFCAPAPTPTPTIACTGDDDCPDGLFCVDGVCRDLSTPTVTPTPLPTCVNDEDCTPPDRCRAMVCVPPRPCEDQIDCRGIREACLNDICECGGDCNVDGIVFGTEITRMVCIVGGQCQIGVCPAGDINQDGEVTSGDVTLAVINLGLGCPGEGSPLIYALDRTNETRTIEIGNASGIPGEFITLDIGISGGDEVTTAQVDILFDPSLLEVSLTEPVCTIDPRLLQAGSFEIESTLPQVPPAPPGLMRMRVAVLDKLPPIESFGPGPLMTCHFRIQPGAAPGIAQLTPDVERLEIGDPAFNEFNAEVVPGAVEIRERPPCETNEQCPEGTTCQGGECRPIIDCDGPMAGPSQCLDGRQACVDNRCQCVGDCDLDGIVRSNEITKMILIINGELPLSECPAADFAGDGIVRSNDITLAVININEGCP